MFMNRRSALRLGALSAVSASVPSLANAFAFASGVGPNPTSVLILVEGPWLITQKSTGVLNCIALADPHRCQMGLWSTPLNKMVSPYDPTQPAPYLPGDAAVTATLKSSNPRPDAVATFDVPFNRTDTGGPDNFVYIRNKPLKAAAQDGDRTLTLPVPDNVYVAGRVLNGAVLDASVPPVIENPLTAKLFVTFVFEYTQDASASTSLTVDDGTGKTFQLTKGQALLMQMQAPEGATSDPAHVTHAFMQQVAHIGSGSPPQLSVTFPTAAVDVVVQVGDNAQGLSVDELGLHVVLPSAVGRKKRKHATDPSDPIQYKNEPSCAGGPIPILP